MLIQVRRRKVLLAALCGATLAALGITVASSRATRLDSAAQASGIPVEMPMSFLNSPAGRLTKLKAGVTYQASSFPIALRVTTADRNWAGAQWQSSAHGKPAYGWAAVGQGPVTKPPRGLVEILTPLGPTPSVAATIARLRTGGSHEPESKIGGITFQEPSPVKIAGYSGRHFDGEVWGKWGHGFIPFSPSTHGGSPSDYLRLDKGEAFRLIVLNVRGRTVVLFLESAVLPAEQFPVFLASANRLLKTLKFPR
jgi:hypothetical protein